VCVQCHLSARSSAGVLCRMFASLWCHGKVEGGRGWRAVCGAADCSFVCPASFHLDITQLADGEMGELGELGGKNCL
jgi:hypothetical protein